jgi:hypothetical protein
MFDLAEQHEAQAEGRSARKAFRTDRLGVFACPHSPPSSPADSNTPPTPRWCPAASVARARFLARALRSLPITRVDAEENRCVVAGVPLAKASCKQRDNADAVLRITHPSDQTGRVRARETRAPRQDVERGAHSLFPRLSACEDLTVDDDGARVACAVPWLSFWKTSAVAQTCSCTSAAPPRKAVAASLVPGLVLERQVETDAVGRNLPVLDCQI